MRTMIYILPLLPTIIYLLYFLLQNRKRKRGEILLGLKNAPWVRVFLVTLLTLTLFLLIAALTEGQRQNESYTPARYENGKFVPSELK